MDALTIIVFYQSTPYIIGYTHILSFGVGDALKEIHKIHSCSIARLRFAVAQLRRGIRLPSLTFWLRDNPGVVPPSGGTKPDGAYF